MQKDSIYDTQNTVNTTNILPEKKVKIVPLAEIPELNELIQERKAQQINYTQGILSLQNVDTTRVQIIEVDPSYTVYTLYISHSHDYKLYNLVYANINGVFTEPSIIEWHMDLDFATAYNAGQKSMTEFKGTLAQYSYNTMFNSTVRSGEIDCDCFKLYLHLKGHSANSGGGGNSNGSEIGGGSAFPGWSYGGGEGEEGGPSDCPWHRQWLYLNYNGEAHAVVICRTWDEGVQITLNGGFNNRNSEDECADMLQGIGLMESSNNTVNAPPSATVDPFETQLSSCRSFNPAVRQRMQELAAQEVYDACNGLPIIVNLEDMEKELCFGCGEKGYTVEALEEMYEKALEGIERIIIISQLQTLCPKYKCIMNMINNGSLSSPSVEEAFDCNGDLESHYVGIFAGSFSSNPSSYSNVNALGAAVVPTPADFNKPFAQQIVINSDFCTNQNVNPVISAELFFHEFYHININYKLFFEHQWDGTQSTRAAKLQLLVNKDYPGKNYTSDHQIMLGEYYNEMLNAIYVANGSIGNLDIYRGLIFNGFGDEEVFIQNKFGYNNSQLISFRNSFTQFINTPGNVSSTLLPCN